ncbi:DUF6542 domain-containing protein [Pseudonocardia endophytica]|uniref:DUF6542 domain-containing protein n=1 Tax=Pseudonocardia endophytica TaxID=401976 RepID=A0A4R1HZC5_PSEEN|nr:DUF6542 domain-containing protein [Pseudonocardia endophytica]TCK26565.1 hypothetical protein EV378_2403 [Pseudonocardia endophytica]
MTDSRTATARRSAASSKPGASATRERPDRARAGSWPVRERSLIGPVLGVPPLVAVALAVGLTALGVFVDLLRIGTVGTIFEVAYGVGCVVAVAWVRRRSLFLPAIQPPLLLAVVVPVLAGLVGAPSSTAGVTEHLLLAGAPLINAFPAMAVTTVLVLLIAGFRLLRQRTGPDDAVGLLRARLSGRSASPDGDGAAGGRGRGHDAERPAKRRSGGAGQGVGRSGRRDGGTAGSAAGRGGTDKDAERSAPPRTRADGDRTGRSSAARDGARDEARGTARPARGRGGRTDGRDTPRADGAGDAGRNTARGSAGRGKPSSGRPVRGSGSGSGRRSGDSARSRRTRPSDPD